MTEEFDDVPVSHDGNIVEHPIHDVLREDYSAYAASVIEGRALTSALDGMKPVHRAILFAMYQMGCLPTKSSTKSARIVGETIGKYHPHGDGAAYDAMANLTQSWRLQHPLITGQGNFGSIDGDSPAAMRYCFSRDTLLATERGLLRFDELVSEREFDALSDGESLSWQEKPYRVGEHPHLDRHLDNAKIDKGKSEQENYTLATLVSLLENQGIEISRCDFGVSQMPLKGILMKSLNLPEKAVKLVYSGVHETVRVQTQDGYEARCTPNEPFYVRINGVDEDNVGFKEAENLSEYDSIALSRTLVPPQSPICPESGYEDGRLAAQDTWQKAVNRALYDNGNMDSFSLSVPAIPLSDWDFLRFQHPSYVRDFIKGTQEESQSPTEYVLEFAREADCLLVKQLLLAFFGVVTGAAGKDADDNKWLLTINRSDHDLRRFDRFQSDIDWSEYFDEFGGELPMEERLYFSPVQSVEVMGEIPVYDLTVENSHVFTANGMLVHNTEAKLSEIGYHGLFENLNENVVEWQNNYDNKEKEPVILPVSYPVLWVNGTKGIAVGLAADLPTHNLKETVDALLAYQKKPNISEEEIAKIMPAPDFPTGGKVSGLDGYLEALKTGKGQVTVTAHFRLEDGLGNVVWDSKNPDAEKEYDEEKIRKRNRKSADAKLIRNRVLVVYEIAYGVAKGKIFESIQNELRNKSNPMLNEWIAAFQDESNAEEPVRLAFYLKNNVHDAPQIIFNHLCKFAGIRSQIYYKVIALDENKKHGYFGIRRYFETFLDFRRRIVTRRTRYRLDKLSEQLHLLQGLKRVLTDTKRIAGFVELLQQSKTTEDNRKAVMDFYGLDDVQAQAVLAMSISKLSGMELPKILKEVDDKEAQAAQLQGILDNPEQVETIIRDELRAFAKKYGTERMTTLSYENTDLKKEDFIKKEDCIVVLTQEGYIKRSSQDSINAQKRNGKGRQSIEMYEDDKVNMLVNTNSHDYILFFTSKGEVLASKVFDIPDGGNSSRGKHIHNLFPQVNLNYQDIIAMLNVESFDSPQYVLMASAAGKVRRSSLSEYKGALKRNGLSGMTAKDKDYWVSARLCRDNDQVIMVSNQANVLRFALNNENLKPVKRTSIGLDGMRLGKGEILKDVLIVPVEESQMLWKQEERDVLVRDDENGEIIQFGKRFTKTGTEQVNVLDNSLINKGKYLLSVSEKGMGKRTPLDEVVLKSRGGTGANIMRTGKKTGDLFAKAAIVTEDDEVILSAERNAVRIAVKDIAVYGLNTVGISLMDVADSRITDIETVS